jgi:hypothetical protein
MTPAKKEGRKGGRKEGMKEGRMDKIKKTYNT